MPYDTSVYLMEFDDSAGRYLAKWVDLCHGDLKQHNLTQDDVNKIAWLLGEIKRDVKAGRRVVIGSSSFRNHAKNELALWRRTGDGPSCYYYDKAVRLLSKLYPDADIQFHPFWVEDLEEGKVLGSSIKAFMKGYGRNTLCHHVERVAYEVSTGEEHDHITNLYSRKLTTQKSKVFLLRAVLSSLSLPGLNYGKMKVRVFDGHLLDEGAFESSCGAMFSSALPVFARNRRLLSSDMTLQFMYFGEENFRKVFPAIQGEGREVWSNYEGFRKSMRSCIDARLPRFNDSRDDEARHLEERASFKPFSGDLPLVSPYDEIVAVADDEYECEAQESAPFFAADLHALNQQSVLLYALMQQVMTLKFQPDTHYLFQLDHRATGLMLGELGTNHALTSAQTMMQFVLYVDEGVRLACCVLMNASGCYVAIKASESEEAKRRREVEAVVLGGGDAQPLQLTDRRLSPPSSVSTASQPGSPQVSQRPSSTRSASVVHRNACCKQWGKRLVLGAVLSLAMLGLVAVAVASHGAALPWVLKPGLWLAKQLSVSAAHSFAVGTEASFFGVSAAVSGGLLARDCVSSSRNSIK